MAGTSPEKIDSLLSGELRESVADGPILFRSVENDHENVLRANARIFAEQFRDAPEQRLLLFSGAGVEHGDLDVHDISTSGDAVAVAGTEVRRVMLRDGHE